MVDAIANSNRQIHPQMTQMHTDSWLLISRFRVFLSIPICAYLRHLWKTSLSVGRCGKEIGIEAEALHFEAPCTKLRSNPRRIPVALR